MSRALLDFAVNNLNRRVDRRSMIRRTTMAATAVVAAPSTFLLKPSTAYAAVCNCSGQGCPCGSLCCDSYTEFCCTLNGSNGCPPGTISAGWWKADGSGFCGGAPRYYVDCNAQCGSCGCSGGLCSGACSGTGCGCANRDCNNRKSGCVKFRYGQCNQGVRCVGPIVCRLVTCSPPWLTDGSCTADSRTDNNTAAHTRPCLEAPFGALDLLADQGGALRVIGWAIDADLHNDIEVRIFVDDRPAVSTPANQFRVDIAFAYPGYGGNHGFDTTIACTPGRHTVCAWAFDPGSQTSTFLAFRTIDVAGPLGSIDAGTAAPGQIDVTGWAVDLAAPQQSPVIRIVVTDGPPVADVTAALPRPDVTALFADIGPNCGFDVSIPVVPGSYNVCVAVIYPSGSLGLLDCKQVIVP